MPAETMSWRSVLLFDGPAARGFTRAGARRGSGGALDDDGSSRCMAAEVPSSPSTAASWAPYTPPYRAGRAS
eukprot:5780774-Prymnesium_polylepis.1